MRKIRVLVVDDSVVYRRLLCNILGEDPDLELASASNGRIALQKVPQFAPDIVSLDVEMPVMSGLETLAHMRKDHPAIPVVMFSSQTAKGASATLDALSGGAADYVTKPVGSKSPAESAQFIRDMLLPKIKSLCADRVGVKDAARPTRRKRHPARRGVTPSRPQLPAPVARAPGRRSSGGFAESIEVVAIGVSTGGPNALAEVFASLPVLPVPIVIVQHMPPVFTHLLAERLTKKSKVPVHEAEEGMRVEPGHAYLAPGDYHMEVVRKGDEIRLHLQQGTPENSCRPAVDVLFRSVAEVYGNKTLAVILTGMGKDGLRGCEELKALGCRIFVQDEETSVVWGMPGFVSRAELADKELPLTQVATEIARVANRGRRPSAALGRS